MDRKYFPSSMEPARELVHFKGETCFSGPRNVRFHGGREGNPQLSSFPLAVLAGGSTFLGGTNSKNAKKGPLRFHVDRSATTWHDTNHARRSCGDLLVKVFLFYPLCFILSLEFGGSTKCAGFPVGRNSPTFLEAEAFACLREVSDFCDTKGIPVLNSSWGRPTSQKPPIGQPDVSGPFQSIESSKALRPIR